MNKKITDLTQYPKNIKFKDSKELANLRKKRRDKKINKALEDSSSLLNKINNYLKD